MMRTRPSPTQPPDPFPTSSPDSLGHFLSAALDHAATYMAMQHPSSSPRQAHVLLCEIVLEFGQFLEQHHAITDEQSFIRQWALQLLQETVAPGLNLSGNGDNQAQGPAPLGKQLDLGAGVPSAGLSAVRLAYLACTVRRLKRIVENAASLDSETAPTGARAAATSTAFAAACLSSPSASAPWCQRAAMDAAELERLCRLSVTVASAAARPDTAAQQLAQQVVAAARALQTRAGGAAFPARLQQTLSAFFRDVAPRVAKGAKEPQAPLPRFVGRLALEGPLSAVLSRLEETVARDEDLRTLPVLAADVTTWPPVITLSQYAAGRIALHRCLHTMTKAAQANYRALRLAAAAAVAVEAKGYATAARSSHLWRRPGPTTLEESDAGSSAASLACASCGCTLPSAPATALTAAPWLDLLALHRAAWAVARHGSEAMRRDPTATRLAENAVTGGVALLPLWRALVAPVPTLAAFDDLRQGDHATAYLMALLDAAECLATGPVVGHGDCVRPALDAIFAATQDMAQAAPARAWVDALKAKTEGL